MKKVKFIKIYKNKILKLKSTSESVTVSRRSLDFGPAIVNTPISSVTFVIWTSPFISLNILIVAMLFNLSRNLELCKDNNNHPIDYIVDTFL